MGILQWFGGSAFSGTGRVRLGIEHLEPRLLLSAVATDPADADSEALLEPPLPAAPAGNVSGHITEDTVWDDTSEPYVLTGDIYIDSGATLTVAPGVEVCTPWDSRDVYIRGTLDAAGASFTGHYTDISVYDGARGDFTNVTMEGALRYLAGSSGTVGDTQGSYHLTLDGDSDVAVVDNDFSSTSVTTTGSELAILDLESNYWGTTDPALIEDKILHHVDDPNRPLADFTPFLSAPPDFQGESYHEAANLGVLDDRTVTTYQAIGNGPAGDRDLDYFRLTLTAPSSVVIDIDAATAGSLLDSYLRLFDSSGGEMAWSDDNPAPGEPWSTDSFIEAALQPGTYYVAVSGWPNMHYTPFAAESGTPGSTGEYTLIVSAASDTPVPPGNSDPIGALSLAGNFAQGSDGIWTATGAIGINDLLIVQGHVSYDAAGNIRGDGELWMRSVPALGDVMVYDGSFEFAAGDVATGALNEALSTLDVVGLDVSVNHLQIAGDAVRLEGHITLPGAFGDFRIDVDDGNYIQLSPTDGLSFSGATFTFPDVDGMAFFGLPFSSSGVVVGVSPDEFTVAGGLELGALLGGTTVSAEISITNADGGKPEVAVAGGLGIAGPIQLGPGFSLEDILLQVDTTTREFRGDATLNVPAGFGIDVGLGFFDGYFNYVSAGVNNLNHAIIYTPTPPPVPVVFLQDVSAAIDHLAPDEVDHTPMVLGGGMAFTAGPQIHLDGEDYYLLRLDVDAEYDTAGRFTGTGQVLMGGGAEPYEFASASLVIDEDYGVYVAGDLNYAGFLTVSGALHLGTDNDLHGALEGTVSAPDWIGGWDLANAKVYGQYIDDGDYDNDYLIAGGQALIWEHAVEFNLNNGEIDWWADYGNLEEVVVPPPPTSTGLTAIAMGDGGGHAFSLPDGLDGALFRIAWDLGDTDMHLRAPDGTLYTPANAGDYANVQHFKDPEGLQAVFEVSDPAGGAWEVIVTNPTGIGGYTVEERGSTARPVITLLEPALDPTGTTVGIEWTDEDSDSDAAISLYYDTDRAGRDGALIANGISQDSDPDTFTWDTAGVPTGAYYVYAVIDDGTNAPTVSYSTGRVTVWDPEAPAAVTGLNAPKGTDTSAHLQWDASAAADLSHYVLRLTDDAAGEESGFRIVSPDAEAIVTGLTQGETYRVTVAAVDVDGHVGPDSDPILVVPGGRQTALPGAGEWQVSALPGAAYDAQLPSMAGETLTAVDLPAGATLSPDGAFHWDVPSDGSGWEQVLVHGERDGGETVVYRYVLLMDDDAPVFVSSDWTATTADASTIEVASPLGLDVSGVVSYRLERDGQVVDAWRTNPLFEDAWLDPDTEYTYRVQLRDGSSPSNESGWSDPFTARTHSLSPEGPALGNVTQTSVEILSIDTGRNPGTTEYAILNVTSGEWVGADGSSSPDPVWQSAGGWTNTTVAGLTMGGTFRFAAKARNAEGVETDLGPASTAHLDRESDVPTVQSVVQNGPVITISFTEPVTLSLKDVGVEDDLGQPMDLTGASVSWAPGDSAGVLDLAGVLPEGEYTLILSGNSIQDLAANLLDGDGDGVEGGDHSAWLDLIRPTGDLVGPAPGGAISLHQSYVDVQYADPQTGIDPGSFGTDDVTIVTAGGALSVDSVEDLGGGAARYRFGDDGERLCMGQVDVTLNAGSVRDGAGNGNGAGQAFAFEYNPARGDLDGDGDVDFWDFMLFVDVYDRTDADPGWQPYAPIGDFEPDGDVDFWDFMGFVDVYGTQTTGAGDPLLFAASETMGLTADAVEDGSGDGDEKGAEGGAVAPADDELASSAKPARRDEADEMLFAALEATRAPFSRRAGGHETVEVRPAGRDLLSSVSVAPCRSILHGNGTRGWTGSAVAVRGSGRTGVDWYGSMREDGSLGALSYTDAFPGWALTDERADSFHAEELAGG